MAMLMPACRRGAARLGKSTSRLPCFPSSSASSKASQSTSTRSTNVAGFGPPPSARWASVCVDSLLPLHSTVAASRLVSRISTGDCLASAIFRGMSFLQDA